MLFSAHPWILFYTERTLRSLSIKSKSKSQSAPPSQLSSPTSRLEQDESRATHGGSFSKGAILTSSTEDDCGLVDALAVAISHVTISEPKRSRLCGPSSPIREQCSSNLSTNNLCKAFWFRFMKTWPTDTTATTSPGFLNGDLIWLAQRSFPVRSGIHFYWPVIVPNLIQPNKLDWIILCTGYVNRELVICYHHLCNRFWCLHPSFVGLHL